MPTRHLLTEPTEELGSGRTSSRSSGTMLWRPTLEPGEERSLLRRTSEAMNTNTPRNLCRSLAVMFRPVIQYWWMDWTLRRIFGRDATVKTLSVELPPDELEKSWLGTKSDFSHLMIQPRNWSTLMVVWACSLACSGVSALISQSSKALWRTAAACWTLVEKSLTQRGDQRTGTLACWPRSVDTCGRPGASEHEGRDRGCLSISSTPDFWWLNGQTLASPSWSVELPCGSWERRDRLQAANLLSSLGPRTTGVKYPREITLVTHSMGTGTDDCTAGLAGVSGAVAWSIRRCNNVHIDIKLISVAWLMEVGIDGKSGLLVPVKTEASGPPAGVVPAGVPWPADPSTPTAGWRLFLVRKLMH